MTVLEDIDVATTERARGSRTRGTGRGGLDTVRENRSRAAQRAIDRRRRRLDRDDRQAGRARPARPAASATVRHGLRQRIAGMPFVVPVLALLVVGLGLSLWLSTKAAQDSYRLGVARQENQSLADRRDSLKRDYESGDSAPELSDKASRLGLIPAKNPARMVVGADGKVRMIGVPEPASGKSMTSINPPNRPDPVDSIDPKKVDDSQGLPGGGATASQAPAATPNTPGTQSDSRPDGSTQPAAPSPAAPAPAGPAPSPAVPGATPSPNVLPSAPTADRNAPGANSARSR